MTRLAVILATVGGAGFFPVASGTFASALTVFPAWWLSAWPAAYAGVTIALTGLGIVVSGKVEALWGEKDPHPVVIDEVVGYLVALAFLPRSWFYPLAAFVLFRIFDVWKPAPIRQLQILPGGWGIVLDDVLAGLYANLILQIVVWISGH